MKSILVMSPPLSTQRTIAAFLDRECGKIDALRGKIETQIEKLDELKKSIITEAVTGKMGVGGKRRKMRPSGVEWIGDVPEGWKVTKLKYNIFVRSNLVPPDDYGDWPQISPECIEKDSGKLIKCWNVSEAGVESGNHLFKKGQIIYSKIRPALNKVTIAQTDGLCSADMYPMDTSEDIKFVLYLLLSNYFVSQVELVTRDRIKMPKINQEELGRVNIVLPPLAEQREIVEYLLLSHLPKFECGAIDAAKGKCRTELEKLSEYKKSLIYECVTGKREVA